VHHSHGRVTNHHGLYYPAARAASTNMALHQRVRQLIAPSCHCAMWYRRNRKLKTGKGLRGLGGLISYGKCFMFGPWAPRLRKQMETSMTQLETDDKNLERDEG